LAASPVTQAAFVGSLLEQEQQLLKYGVQAAQVHVCAVAVMDFLVILAHIQEDRFQ
jgi:hypothetical protein